MSEGLALNSKRDSSSCVISHVLFAVVSQRCFEKFRLLDSSALLIVYNSFVVGFFLGSSSMLAYARKSDRWMKKSYHQCGYLNYFKCFVVMISLFRRGNWSITDHLNVVCCNKRFHIFVYMCSILNVNVHSLYFLHMLSTVCIQRHLHLICHFMMSLFKCTLLDMFCKVLYSHFFNEQYFCRSQ